MKLKAAWTTMVVLSMIAAAISFLLFILSTGLASWIFLMSTVLFISSSAVMLSSRKKHLESISANEFVRCFRLKRPGIVKQNTEDIIPKGKMPR